MKTTQQMQHELKEQAEHQAVLLNIQAVVATKPGKDFIKYLLQSFEVGEMPPIGLSGEFLHERLGFYRAGNSIFKIIAEASPEFAGAILAQIEKEKNAQNIDYT